MYCSICGGAVAPGLSYCNHCGEKLSGSKNDGATNQSELFPESLVWAIVTVFIVGLGGTIGLIAVMKEVAQFNQQFIVGFTAASFAMMLAVEVVLIWLLLSRKSRSKEAGDTIQLKTPTTKQLDAHEGLLAEPSSSITEQTTRTLDPVFRKEKAE